MLHTGCRWEDLPHDIAVSPKTCNRRLLEYQRRRVWQRIVAELLQEADRRGMLNLKNCSHEASVVKSKKGRIRKSATLENTGLKESLASLVELFHLALVPWRVSSVSVRPSL